jgi:hypothetical protein
MVRLAPGGSRRPGHLALSRPGSLRDALRYEQRVAPEVKVPRVEYQPLIPMLSS